MKKLFAAAIIALSVNANAAPKESDLWITLATSTATGTSYSVLKESGQFNKNDNGVPVYVVTGRTVDKNGDISALMWYVKLEQCVAGKGHLTTTDPLGNFVVGTQYAFGMGTVASQIAETLCNVAEASAADLNKKSPPKKSKGTV